MLTYILAGGNIGPVRENLRRAKAMIGERVGQVVRASGLYRSPAWGFESPDPFYNVALAVETTLEPTAVMTTLLEIERQLGRERGEAMPTPSDTPDGVETRPVVSAGSAAPSATGIPVTPKTYASRPIDLDILFYDKLALSTPFLAVPHPRLPLRRFALVPLNEIAPNLIHPTLNQTISQLLAACPDKSEVVLV